MCSQFLKRMDNYQGDLTDILRASGANPVGQASAAAQPDWQFPANYPACPPDDFGLPFLRDPLLHDIDSTPISGFFQNSDIIKDETAGFATVGDHHDQMKRPPNIFSRMLQISPTTKLPPPSPEVTGATRGAKAPPMLVCNDRSVMSSSKSCLVESQALQISSPRNTGIRRRKSQAKKVVCIPAPAPANSKSSGEVVPSDLWAWRKYGQKPIKGSPYPRGYYRCSSSKGCSARKQVERSRTDPNMLVITYTSEHNHPWPTQRNALAGSTRSQPSKTSTAQKHSPPKSTKEEESTSSAAVKEENMDQDFDLKMDDADQFDHEGFPQSYKPALPDSNQSEDSFFADLGEIEADSLDMLLFDGRDSKGLDPFEFYDWAGGATAAASTSSPGSCSGAGSGATRTDS